MRRWAALPHGRGSGARRGSLLIIALWFVVILSVAAVALGGYLGTETRLMRYHIAQGQARVWARTGVYLAMQKLALDAKADDGDWLGDDWAVTLQPDSTADPSLWVVPMPPQPPSAVGLTGRVEIQMTDEERRLDLNSNSTNLNVLQRLLGNPEAAKALFDYRGPPDEGPDTSVQPPYVPKNAPIAAVEELTDVPHISGEPAVVAMLQQQGTLTTGGTVNINTVSATVLKVLVSDVTSYPLIDQLIASRPGGDGQFGTADDCYTKNISTAASDLGTCAGLNPAGQNSLIALLSGLTYGVASSTFRIRATGVITKPAIRYTVEAIVTRSSAASGGSGGGAGGGSTSTGGEELPFHEQAFHVLSWREG